MKKSEIDLSPPYTSLIQKPCCCAVTCLQMILYRRGYGLFEQESLARFFRVKVSPDDVDVFSFPIDTFTSLNLDEGMPTVESEERVREFFQRHNIQLSVNAFLTSEIPDLERFVWENLTANNDLWAEYKAHNILGEQFIHDGLIESAVREQGTTEIVLTDSGRDRKQRIKIKIAAMQEAISEKLGRETGFLIISD